MTDDHIPQHHHVEPVGLHKNKLVLFVVGSIILALILVVISMTLYTSSGTAQLDLSRPGYQSVQDKVERSDMFKEFPSTGDIDRKTLEEFRKLYDKQVQQVTASDAFSVGVMSNQSLGIDTPGADQ